jgi:hypothetical protein
MKHTQLNISFRVGMSVYIAESWSVKYLIIHLYPFTSYWTYLILNMTTRFTLFDELNTCCGVILWWQSYVLIVSVKLWALFSEQCVMVVIYVNDASRVEQFLYRIIQACPAQICASYTVSVIQTIVSYCFESPLTLCDFLLLCCRWRSYESLDEGTCTQTHSEQS